MRELEQLDLRTWVKIQAITNDHPIIKMTTLWFTSSPNNELMTQKSESIILLATTWRTWVPES